jgi:hypothetical protein
MQTSKPTSKQTSEAPHLWERTAKSKELPVDGTTNVPEDLFISLLQAADRAKVRGSHTLEIVRSDERSEATGGAKRSSSRKGKTMRLVKTRSQEELRTQPKPQLRRSAYTL